MDYNSTFQYIICKVLGLSQVFAWYLAIKMTRVESQLEPPMGSGNVSSVAEEKKFNPRLTQNKALGNSSKLIWFIGKDASI